MAKGTQHQSSTAVADPLVRATSADPQESYVGEINRPVTHEQVAQRAYELYLDRGGEDGADLDDWLQAERELRRSTSASGARDE